MYNEVVKITDELPKRARACAGSLLNLCAPYPSL